MPQPYPNGELVIVIDCSGLDRSARFWAAVLASSPPGSWARRCLEAGAGGVLYGDDVLGQRGRRSSAAARSWSAAGIMAAGGGLPGAACRRART